MQSGLILFRSYSVTQEDCFFEISKFRYLSKHTDQNDEEWKLHMYVIWNGQLTYEVEEVSYPFLLVHKQGIQFLQVLSVI